MILLSIFSFIAGIVTILSPCILPILPIILSSSFGASNDKFKPIGIVIGFVTSFTFFTLFLSIIVNLLNIPAEILRYVAVFIIAGFGISQLSDKFQLYLENLFSKLSKFTPNAANKNGLSGGLLIGLSLGLLWTPCVGPILASVISLAITGTVTLNTFIITLAYSLGTSIPMFGIIIGGRKVIQKSQWLVKNTHNIQKIFGVMMIATATAIFFNADRKFQTYILNIFPNYGVGLTKIEDNELILKELKKLDDSEINEQDLGKPLNNVTLNKIGIAPEIIAGGEWFNVEKPLKLSELKNKVVLVDFWTYTCINCQRTFPYLKEWWRKYADEGLVIIGVHSPEFEFEKSPKNVSSAISDFELKYPIVQDNNFETWKNYNNRYWPAKYLIDKEGNIRYTHFGEGEYDETEKAIQTLLNEKSENKIALEIDNPDYEIYSRTPELYLGYLRIKNFASPNVILQDKINKYSAPTNLPQNSFAFEGDVIITEEFSNPQSGSKLVLNFDAKEVFLVMNSKTDLSKVRIYLDDGTEYLGEDVVEGIITVTQDSLYKIVKLPNPGKHIIKLEFLDNNTEVYAFTFG